MSIFLRAYYNFMKTPYYWVWISENNKLVKQHIIKKMGRKEPTKFLMDKKLKKAYYLDQKGGVKFGKNNTRLDYELEIPAEKTTHKDEIPVGYELYDPQNPDHHYIMSSGLLQTFLEENSIHKINKEKRSPLEGFIALAYLLVAGSVAVCLVGIVLGGW